MVIKYRRRLLFQRFWISFQKYLFSTSNLFKILFAEKYYLCLRPGQGVWDWGYGLQPLVPGHGPGGYHRLWQVFLYHIVACPHHNVHESRVSLQNYGLLIHAKLQTTNSETVDVKEETKDDVKDWIWTLTHSDSFYLSRPLHCRYAYVKAYKDYVVADCEVACAFAAQENKPCALAETGIADGIENVDNPYVNCEHYAPDWSHLPNSFLNAINPLKYTRTWPGIGLWQMCSRIWCLARTVSDSRTYSLGQTSKRGAIGYHLSLSHKHNFAPMHAQPLPQTTPLHAV